jgi:hypothetical protein
MAPKPIDIVALDVDWYCRNASRYLDEHASAAHDLTARSAARQGYEYETGLPSCRPPLTNVFLAREPAAGLTLGDPVRPVSAQGSRFS